MSVTLHLDGTFDARLRVHETRVACADLGGFTGRWVVGDGLIVTATSVRARPVAPDEHGASANARRARAHAVEELAS